MLSGRVGTSTSGFITYSRPLFNRSLISQSHEYVIYGHSCQIAAHCRPTTTVLIWRVCIIDVCKHRVAVAEARGLPRQRNWIFQMGIHSVDANAIRTRRETWLPCQAEISSRDSVEFKGETRIWHNSLCFQRQLLSWFRLRRKWIQSVTSVCQKNGGFLFRSKWRTARCEVIYPLFYRYTY